ncbi:hypothetical protein AK829_07580 [Corynebacterium riegelii]|uniref:Uncharacterized protein n=1 Tax=Corynebacterium riegelii TaxID=156976 RepID=A0A0K1RCC0_9CORY|nr:hypothetical protein AK829_07580 [Corynebacterium riegelii]
MALACVLRGVHTKRCEWNVYSIARGAPGGGRGSRTPKPGGTNRAVARPDGGVGWGGGAPGC